MNSLYQNDTIIALATSSGAGAIAVIRLSGSKAIAMVDASFKSISTKKLVSQKTHTIHCTVTAKCTGKTGVEMEALTATSVALLTIYDMCKAVDRGMVMNDIKLLEKSGGKSGTWVAEK